MSTAVLILFLLTSTVTAFNSILHHKLASQDQFDWTNFEASRSLQFRTCYNGFECAKLLLPQNWNDLDDKQSVAIAIIKLPASVRESHPRHGGTIITNPGGPGGSGVADLLVHGRYLQSVVNGDKQFDVLSFDPRGVHHSTPTADCFENSAARRMFSFQEREIGFLDEDASVLKRRRALAQAFGQICANSESSSSSQSYLARAHMTTAVVARDMLEIVNQIENERQGKPDPRNGSSEAEAGLQYLGFSYGTHLGNTFVSMFPNRVKSMVLDGVVDSNDYSGGMWSKNLFDAEAAVDYFFDTCFAAGIKCALWSSRDNSGLTIRARVQYFLDKIIEQPGTWVEEGFSEVITAQAIRALFLIPLYKPLSNFEQLAISLKNVLEGNFTSIVYDWAKYEPVAIDLCRSIGGDQEKVDYEWVFESAMTYMCNDSPDLSHVSNSDLQKYIVKLRNLSPTIGPYWAQFSLTCSGWKVRPEWQFTGPYGRNVSQNADQTPSVAGDRYHRPKSRQRPQNPLNHNTNNGNNPILFLSSKTDPVTPVRNAIAMSALHPGSSVVIQDSVGHSALHSAPSKCTKKVVAEYFAHGTMPKDGLVCEADCRPWQSGGECAAFDEMAMERGVRGGGGLRGRGLPFMP